jgi:two-component system, sensor histidine kinase and response regulator
MKNGPRETILIVDDQEENLRVVGSVLSMMDYDIVAASSAEQAFKRLAAHTPDLILLDVHMPETDGLATCRAIKADARWVHIPIIFLSAADDKNLIVQALEAGGVDYVTKPFNRAELISRVRTQLALKHARDRLKALAEDKDEILGILAHDLKNGLAGIQLSAGLLHSRVEELPPRCGQLAENILHTADRLLAYMKEFLANQHAEQLLVKAESVNLAEVILELANTQQPAASAKGIALMTQLPETSVLVTGDREGLTQVFENLISNAIKFSAPSGKVQVIVQAPVAGMVKCFVSDSGPGFTEEDRTKLFRRYGRLSARPTGNEPSTGLGLSIVKGLLESMGGHITLAENSATTSGAEFILVLPVTPTDSSPA